MLELRSPALPHQTVILLADESRELGGDEVAAAAALVDVAALALGCAARSTKQRPTS